MWRRVIGRCNPFRTLRTELENARSKIDGFAAERGAYLRQRDEALGEGNELLRQRDHALGERNEFLRQRDEALGERNEFLRQRDEAISDAASSRRATATSSSPGDILAVARENLSEALSDQTDGLPDPGPRWGTIAAWCREKIPTFRTAVEAIHFAQIPTRHGGFEARLTGEALAERVADRERQISEDFPSVQRHLGSFEESELSHHPSTMTYHGRRVSSPMYAHTAVFLNCATRIPRMNTVCEIGGGYGAPARLFLTNSYRRPNSYVIVDLPESLFFAEVYLGATLGSDRVHYLRRGETLDSSPYDVLLCPISRVAALRPVHFDLVLNTLSMQEMTDDYVAFYRDWLDLQSADYFYSWNYFMQGADYLGESGNLFAPRLSAKWSIVWSLFVSNKPNSFLHVLAQRHPLDISHSIARPLSPTSLYPLLHAADNAPDARFPYELMTALVEDFDPPPKEALFAALGIEKLQLVRPVLTFDEVLRTRDIAARISSKFAGSISARVPPHWLRGRRRVIPSLAASHNRLIQGEVA